MSHLPVVYSYGKNFNYNNGNLNIMSKNVSTNGCMKYLWDTFFFSSLFRRCVLLARVTSAVAKRQESEMQACLVEVPCYFALIN